jgi:hypothetical protein
MAIATPTVSQVRTIITTELTDDQIESIIDDAVLMVENCVASLSESLQRAIVKWVSAHLIASLSVHTNGGAGNITSESLGDASTSYSLPTLKSDGLGTTTYGLQAIALDPNGCLAMIGQRRTLVKVL